jgi:hypothetical protein
MSCFIVSREHIHVLVDAAFRFMRTHGASDFSFYTPLRNASESGTSKRFTYAFDEHDRLGAMLEAENLRSYTCRYGERTATEESVKLADPYVHRPPRKKLTTIELLKAVHCYEYQACESTDWEFTQARAFCHSLERSIVCAMPGYSEAPWGVEP